MGSDSRWNEPETGGKAASLAKIAGVGNLYIRQV